MSTSTPVSAPPHVLQLLKRLHRTSLDQEAALSKSGKVFSAKILGNLKDKSPDNTAEKQFDELMLDKFIALDEDKCHFMYQLIIAMNATNVVEAGTSFGVSTIYIALAVAEVKSTTGKTGLVIATEKEKRKAEVARYYWKTCGPEVENQIELREGDLLETLKTDLPPVDLLLLDSKSQDATMGLFC